LHVPRAGQVRRGVPGEERRGRDQDVAERRGARIAGPGADDSGLAARARAIRHADPRAQREREVAVTRRSRRWSMLRGMRRFAWVIVPVLAVFGEPPAHAADAEPLPVASSITTE